MHAYAERELREWFLMMDRDCLGLQAGNVAAERRIARTDQKVYGDRPAHAWHLGRSGVRRGEITGLRWSDADLG